MARSLWDRQSIAVDPLGPARQSAFVPSSLDAFARDKTAALAEADLLRQLREQRRPSATTVERGGRTLVSFSCNDMLGLAHHPTVIAAATAAVAAEGTGAGASRLVTGSSAIVTALEQALARFRGTDRALVFGSGSLANLGVIPAFAGPQDLVILDERAHSSLFSGARLSRARVATFAHNDVAHLRSLLAQGREQARHIIVAVEGVYSMDGDLAPLPAIVDACEEADAWLLVDDAHALGTLGEGQGTAAHFGIAPDRIAFYVATLSKALGSYGGVVGCSEAVYNFLTSRARTLVYTTGLPPASAAAALAALEVVQEDRARRERPLELAKRFAAALGLPTPEAHLVPLIVGEAADALAAQSSLEALGYLVTAIRPPTVKSGTARLRVSFSAEHSDADVDGLAAGWRQVQARLQSPKSLAS